MFLSPLRNPLLDDAFCMTMALWCTPIPSWQLVLDIKAWSTFKLFKATTFQSSLNTHSKQSLVMLHLHCLLGANCGSKIPFEQCLGFLSEGALWLVDKIQKRVVAGQWDDQSYIAKQRIIQMDRICAPNAASPVPKEPVLWWEKTKPDCTRWQKERCRLGLQFFFCWLHESFLSRP